MKITIMGGMGLIGRALRREILSTTTKIEINIVGKCKHHNYTIDNQREVYYSVDKLENAVNKSELFVNLLPPSGKNYNIGADYSYLTKEMIELDLLVNKIIRKHKMKYILTSSGAVYDENAGDRSEEWRGYSEEDPIKTKTESYPYAEFKKIQEHNLIKSTNETGMQGVILRLFSIYGEEMRDRKGFLFQSLISEGLSKRVININNPDQLRDYISTKMVSKIICHFILNDIKGIYNICGRQKYTIKDIGIEVGKQLSVPVTISARKAEMSKDTKRSKYIGCNEKLEYIFPSITIEEEVLHDIIKVIIDG